MIRYALACDKGHGFETWFRDSAAFDDLVRQGLVSCPQCGSVSVQKQIMAPAVARTDRDAPVAPPSQQEDAQPTPAAAPLQGEVTGPLALMGEREKAFRELLKAVRDHVVSTAENVGPRFAEEARRMHDGVSEFTSIYGQATEEEARALADEGIDAIPLPAFPDDRH